MGVIAGKALLQGSGKAAAMSSSMACRRPCPSSPEAAWPLGVHDQLELPQLA
jgi:hypothetical protein